MTYKVSNSCQIDNINSFYEKYFDGKTNGYFVEIGAYDGYTFSNTWGLAEAGWKGLYVEPIPKIARRCVKVHKNNKVVVANYAISDFDGEVQLYTGPRVRQGGKYIDFPSSTTEYTPDKATGWGKKYNPDRHMTVPVITIDQLLKMYKVPHKFDLLVIDVEGAEMKVLNGFSWRKWLPKMIIIETTTNVEEIDTWFVNRNYKCIHTDVYNSIYVIDKI